MSPPDTCHSDRNTNKDLGYCRCYQPLVQLSTDELLPQETFFFKKLARKERLSHLISFQVRSEEEINKHREAIMYVFIYREDDTKQ
jgi:hypothetical protein